MQIVGFVYMLRCADGSYYIGSRRGRDPERRVWGHNHGMDKHAYTFTRRPVELFWSEWHSRYDEMVARERQIKGWSRAKKEALIRSDGGALVDLSKRGVKPYLVAHPSRRGQEAAPQDEEIALGQGAAPQDEGIPCHQTETPHPEERALRVRLEGWAARTEGEA